LRAPAESTVTLLLLGIFALAVAADSVLKEDRNYALAEPGQEVLVGAEQARGAWAASVREEARSAQGKGEHEVAHDDAAREQQRQQFDVPLARSDGSLNESRKHFSFKIESALKTKKIRIFNEVS